MAMVVIEQHRPKHYSRLVQTSGKALKTLADGMPKNKLELFVFENSIIFKKLD